jgi:hypothetical protein
MRTIASMDLLYKDKKYHLDYDFKEEYPEKSARYIFFDGNYSCDCNKSLFIQRYCDKDFPEMECGDEIEIQNFELNIIQ